MHRYLAMSESDRSPPGLSAAERLTRRAAAKPGLISFAGGLPDPALFPKRDLAEAFLSALTAHGRVALQYGWPEGSGDLRDYVAGRLRQRGAQVDAEDVIITSGAQQAVLLALSAAPQRRAIGVDAESYPGALDAFRAAGAELVSLEQRAPLYYVMPAVGNPRGQRMTEDERTALLHRARRHRGYVLEDDAYEGTSFDGVETRPLLADALERVFHIGTFSKTLCPGLRIGWLVPPRRLSAKALRRKQTQDLQANGLTQALLIEYLKGGRLERLKERARRRYRRKLGVLQAVVRRLLPDFRFTPPLGGFSLWLESERGFQERALLRAAVERGVSFDPGSSFRALGRGKAALRLCYSAVPEGEIERGVERLAQALRVCKP